MSTKSTKIRVLVADEAQPVADRICQALVDIPGVEVVGPAMEGQQALQLFDRHAPELALIDLHMPGVDGIELLREIRKRASECVVVMLTDNLEPATQQRCMSLGADYFLRKSTDFETAIAIVRRYASHDDP